MTSMRSLFAFIKIDAALVMIGGGNAEKWTFYWVIATPKYGCVVVEWVVGFNEK